MKLQTIATVFLGWTISVLAAAQSAAQAPRIDSISPPDLAPGATVTITGSNFGMHPGIVWIANGPAKTVTWTDRGIVATIPAMAVSGTVWVGRKDPDDNAQGGYQFAWSDGSQSIALATPPTSHTGIEVHNVSVYDNLLLQQMLNSDRTRLSGMQFLDSTKVAGAIGTIQGASMQQTGFSLSVGGPPIPGVTTQVNSGNTATTQAQGTTSGTSSATMTTTTTSGTPAAGTGPSNTLAVTAPTSTTGQTGSNSTVLTGPSTQTTYTLSQPVPPTPAAPPANAFTAPSSFSPSAANILNEQVQLNSEVAGLALMMAGPVTDRAYPVELPDHSFAFIQKHHLTLGIPITLTPSDEDRNAAAEIVLTFRPNPGQGPGDPPQITAILPQAKTYNTATITNKSVSLSGGVVTGVLTAGVNFLWQKQTYYIVQAQDTIAFQLPPDQASPGTISFGWDLRPVLGSPTVAAGMRTLFVQLAVPWESISSNFGTVTVTTRWKKIDKKTNLVSLDSFDEAVIPQPFKILDPSPAANVQSIDDPVDNGDGSVSVHVTSNFFPESTYLKIGGATISQGATNAVFNLNADAIDFTVPASLLATQKASLMDQTGNSTELVEPLVGVNNKEKCLLVAKAEASPESATSAKVTATLSLNRGTGNCDTYIPTDQQPGDLHLIGVLGSTVFGYRNAPITFDPDNKTISFHAPLDLVKTSPRLIVKRLFWGKPLMDEHAVELLPIPIIDKATVVKKGKDNLEIALMGSNLMQLEAPKGAAFKADGKKCDQNRDDFGDTDISRMLCVPALLLTGMAQIPLKTKGGDIQLVALPAPAKAVSNSGPSLTPQGSLLAGKAADLTVKGTKLETFDHVELAKKKVPAELAADKESIVVHLTADLVKAPKIVLVFFFKGSANVSYTVNVNK
jgi:hypothetical protein